MPGPHHARREHRRMRRGLPAARSGAPRGVGSRDPGDRGDGFRSRSRQETGRATEVPRGARTLPAASLVASALLQRHRPHRAPSGGDGCGGPVRPRGHRDGDGDGVAGQRPGWLALPREAHVRACPVGVLLHRRPRGRAAGGAHARAPGGAGRDHRAGQRAVRHRAGGADRASQRTRAGASGCACAAGRCRCGGS